MMRLAQIWRRKRRRPTSHFVSALDRVRDIREHAAWEPLTAPSSIQQRADRVADMREHIIIPPLASERETRRPSNASRLFWLWDLLGSALVAIGGFLAILFVWLMFMSND